MVSDNDNNCVGVVWEHNSHDKNANGQAEVCFYDSHFNDYGKWHRMFYGGHRGGKRIPFKEIQTTLIGQDEYKYIGYIIQK
jgi:hypothetical protein